MALALEVEKLDAVPESQRAWYVEDAITKKFRLDPNKVEIEDPTSLKTALEREKQNAKAADKVRKELEARFAGIDPDKVRDMMARFEGDEEGKLIAAGKIDEVVARRTEKLSKELQKHVDAAAAGKAAAEARANKFSQRVLDNAIRIAATGKVNDPALKSGDVMRAAREVFTLTEDGEAVQLDADGNVVMSKDGKTPFTPDDWIEESRAIRPHWFPAGGSGGGAGGDGGAKGGGKTITRAQFEGMNPVERSKAIKEGIKIIDA